MSDPIADERVIAPMPAAEMAELKSQIERRWADKPWYPGGDDPMSSPGCMMRAQEILALIASVETAQTEIALLGAGLEHYKQLAEEGTAPLIKSMKLEDGHFEMSVTGPIVEAFAVALVGQFKEGGAKNYMEMSVFDRDEPFQRYTVTVQKVGAKSPADLVNDKSADLAAKDAEIARIADDFHPDKDEQAPAALQEMRDALLALLDPPHPSLTKEKQQ